MTLFLLLLISLATSAAEHRHTEEHDLTGDVIKKGLKTLWREACTDQVNPSTTLVKTFQAYIVKNMCLKAAMPYCFPTLPVACAHSAKKQSAFSVPENIDNYTYIGMRGILCMSKKRGKVDVDAQDVSTTMRNIVRHVYRQATSYYSTEHPSSLFYCTSNKLHFYVQPTKKSSHRKHCYKINYTTRPLPLREFIECHMLPFIEVRINCFKNLQEIVGVGSLLFKQLKTPALIAIGKELAEQMDGQCEVVTKNHDELCAFRDKLKALIAV